MDIDSLHCGPHYRHIVFALGSVYQSKSTAGFSFVVRSKIFKITLYIFFIFKIKIVINSLRSAGKIC